MKVGMKVDVDPIPPIAENTRICKAGVLTFGVEYRVLNDQIVKEQYGSSRVAAMRERQEYGLPDKIDDSGVSIHVFGDDGLEYLRFDCFEEDPHYHYVLPHHTYQQVVAFDSVANGDPLTWTMACLRTRLVPMLREGGMARTDHIDLNVVHDALAQVERMAERFCRRRAEL